MISKARLLPGFTSSLLQVPNLHGAKRLYCFCCRSKMLLRSTMTVHSNPEDGTFPHTTSRYLLSGHRSLSKPKYLRMTMEFQLLIFSCTLMFSRQTGLVSGKALTMSWYPQANGSSKLQSTGRMELRLAATPARTKTWKRWPQSTPSARHSAQPSGSSYPHLTSQWSSTGHGRLHISSTASGSVVGLVTGRHHSSQGRLATGNRTIRCGRSREKSLTRRWRTKGLMAVLTVWNCSTHLSSRCCGLMDTLGLTEHTILMRKGWLPKSKMTVCTGACPALSMRGTTSSCRCWRRTKTSSGGT